MQTGKDKLISYLESRGGQLTEVQKHNVDVIVVNRNYFLHPGRFSHDQHFLQCKNDLSVRFVGKSEYLEQCAKHKTMLPFKFVFFRFASFRVVSYRCILPCHFFLFAIHI